MAIPAGACSKAAVVRADWFWVSIRQVARAPEGEFPVPREQYRRPPQRGSVRSVGGRDTVLQWLRGKENVDPSPSPSPAKHRRLSMVSISSLGGYGSNTSTPDKTLLPALPATPGARSGTPTGGPWLPTTPTTPTTPELYADRTCK